MASNLHIPVPSSLDLSNGNVAENFRRWKRQLNLYLTASGAYKLGGERQTAFILHCAGSEAINVFDQFSFAKSEDSKDPEIVLEKFQEYCCHRESEVFHSFKFWNCAYRSPFDSFVTELRTIADQCFK